MNQRSLRDGHFGLRDGAVSGDLDGRSAEQMQDADAALPAFLVHANELLECSLKPRRHHDAIFMPYGAEALPIPGVAPHGPVFHDFLDRQGVEGFFVHGVSLRRVR